MDKHRMFLVVLVVLLTNAVSAVTSGMLCYNAGWKEALDFCTANHVQAIQDLKKP